MRQLTVHKNDENQRLDKYLKKYLKEAPGSFIYKMLRKKNIVLNGKKADGSVRYRPYKEYLENSGMDSSLVEGHVPYIYNKGKGDEIDEYLRENQVDKFIVIDDNDNGNGNVGDLTLLRFKDELIVCDGDRGFTEREYKKALEILAKDRTYILKGKCQDDLEIEI